MAVGTGALGNATARSASARPALVPVLGTAVLALVATAIGTAAPGPGVSPGGRVFLAALAAAFAAYACAALLLESRRARLSIVLALGVAIQLVPLAGPLLLSADVRSYAAYGRIDEALGGNPYADRPAAFASDPVVAAVAGGWRETPSVYGPVFAGLARAVARAAGDDPAAAARLYRFIAAASVLALMGLAAAVSSRPDRAAAFVGWNPLLAVHFAGGGHNDATMMALVLAGLAVTSRGRPRLGALLWVGAAAIKWIPAPLYALSALAARRRGEPSGLAAFVATSLVLAFAATWRYGLDWVRVVAPLARAAEAQTHYSLARRLHQVGIPSAPAAVLVTAAAVAAAVALVRSALAGRARLGLAACVVVAASPWLLPWYAVWPVALGAIESDRASRFAALAIVAYLLPARVVIWA